MGDRLDDEDAVFFNQQIAIAPAVILRRKQRAIVAIATAMHKQLAFHAALGAEVVDHIHEFCEWTPRHKMFQARIIHLALQLDGWFPGLGYCPEENRLLLLGDQTANHRVDCAFNGDAVDRAAL